MSLKAGDIFIIKNFEDGRYGEPKDFWFLYLGETSALQDPIYVYKTKATSQIQKYNKRPKDGERRITSVVKFSPESSVFIKDTIIDLNERPYSVAKDKLVKYDKEYKGALTQSQIQEIWAKLKSSKSYSKIIKKDILRSLLEAGFKELYLK